MKSNINFLNFYVIFFGILFYSCETVVDVDIPFGRPQVTMNTNLKANEFPKVRLSFSKHALDNNYIYDPIENAQVFLESDGVSYELTFDKDAGHYINLEIMVQTGKSYTVMASVPEYPIVTASEKIPEIIPIISFTYNGESERDPWSREQDITITFDDPIGENFYEISGYVIRKITFTDQSGNIVEQTDLFPIYMNPKNPTYQKDHRFDSKILINDLLFDGNKVNIEVFANGNYFNSDEDFEVYLTLNSVSESYYKFHTTYGLQWWNQGDPFAQPVQVYTNIQNGIGIMTGEASYIYQVK